MSCQQVRQLLDAYLDRELDVVTTVQFDRHLTECAGCRDTFESYRRLHDTVKTQIPYFKAPEEFAHQVRTRLRPGERVQDEAISGGRFYPWRGWAMLVSLAILLLVSGAVLLILRRSSASEMVAQQVVAGHIRSLMANHLTDVLSSDQHTVKPWFSGKLDFAPVVKDLSSDGFSLVGGRLDYFDNREVAALVYKHRQHTINLFVWPSPASDSSTRRTTIKGYNVLSWTHGHMAYWAVSDLNADELTELARDVIRK